MSPLSNAEIEDVLRTARNVGLSDDPKKNRVFASLAELATLRDAVKAALKNCYPCAGTGRLSADFDFSGEGGVCGACKQLREAFRPG